ncbi:MAG: hypothetical protein ABGY42_09020, partial [bacterium]
PMTAEVATDVIDGTKSVESVVVAAPLDVEAFALAEIYGLHNERAEDLDRTAILSDETVAYTMSAPDATTVIVSIPNARISQAASDRIFPKSGGPVSLIHAFQQPEVSTPEVRVVFTRAPNQERVISRRGSMLFVDFEDLGVAAAGPPAFPNAGAEEDVAATQVAVVDDAINEAPAETAFTETAEPVAAVMPVPVESDAVVDTSPQVPESLPVEVETARSGFDTDPALENRKTLLEIPLPIRFAPLPVCGTPTELATSTALARARYRPVAPGAVVQAERTG